MVRAARAAGDGSLMPTGCLTYDDISYDLMSAFGHAHTVLGWNENLPPDEVPPEWMWPFPDELEEWFDEVEFLREQKYSSGGDDMAEMDRNEYAKDLDRKSKRRG